MKMNLIGLRERERVVYLQVMKITKESEIGITIRAKIFQHNGTAIDI